MISEDSILEAIRDIVGCPGGQICKDYACLILLTNTGLGDDPKYADLVKALVSADDDKIADFFLGFDSH